MSRCRERALASSPTQSSQARTTGAPARSSTSRLTTPTPQRRSHGSESSRPDYPRPVLRATSPAERGNAAGLSFSETTRSYRARSTLPTTLTSNDVGTTPTRPGETGAQRVGDQAVVSIEPYLSAPAVTTQEASLAWA